MRSNEVDIPYIFKRWGGGGEYTHFVYSCQALSLTAFRALASRIFTLYTTGNKTVNRTFCMQRHDFLAIFTGLEKIAITICEGITLGRFKKEFKPTIVKIEPKEIKRRNLSL